MLGDVDVNAKARSAKRPVISWLLPALIGFLGLLVAACIGCCRREAADGHGGGATSVRVTNARHVVVHVRAACGDDALGASKGD